MNEHPNDAWVHCLLAEALSLSPPDAKPDGNQPRVNRATAAAKRAAQLNPQLAEVYDLLGSLYLKTGQLQLAIQACRAAWTIDPKDQQGIYSLIHSLRKTGDKEEFNGPVKDLTDLRRGLTDLCRRFDRPSPG